MVNAVSLLWLEWCGSPLLSGSPGNPPGLLHHCGHPGVYPAHAAPPSPSKRWVTSRQDYVVSVLTDVYPPNTLALHWLSVVGQGQVSVCSLCGGSWCVLAVLLGVTPPLVDLVLSPPCSRPSSW